MSRIIGETLCFLGFHKRAGLEYWNEPVFWCMCERCGETIYGKPYKVFAIGLDY